MEAMTVLGTQHLLGKKPPLVESLAGEFMVVFFFKWPICVVITRGDGGRRALQAQQPPPE